MSPASLSGLASWLSSPEGVQRRWLGKVPVRIAWLGLLLAVVIPPHGTGFTVCWLKASSGIACPGCGMTRSMSCAIRGLFAESWQYHPFGLMVVGLFVATALFSLLPAAQREALGRALERRSVLCNSTYLAFFGLFIAYGVVRALLQMSGAVRLAL